MRSKNYQCEGYKDLWDRHQDDIEELLWQEDNRRRRERDNALCGYYEPEGEEDDADNY